MTDSSARPRHRGPHRDDAALFGAAQVPALRAAVDDLAWLRGRAEDASLKLVGDRYQLRERARIAVQRATASVHAAASRQGRRVEVGALHGADLAIDGFNCLVTCEAALSGALILACRDGAPAWSRPATAGSSIAAPPGSISPPP